MGNPENLTFGDSGATSQENIKQEELFKDLAYAYVYNSINGSPTLFILKAAVTMAKSLGNKEMHLRVFRESVRKAAVEMASLSASEKNERKLDNKR